jgi:hypothetical protein
MILYLKPILKIFLLVELQVCGTACALYVINVKFKKNVVDKIIQLHYYYSLPLTFIKLPKLL